MLPPFPTRRPHPRVAFLPFRARLRPPRSFLSPLLPRPARELSVRRALLLLGLIFALPLIGVLVAGRSLASFFRFPPPQEIPTGYVHFSWLAVAAVAALLAAITWSWLVGRRRSFPPEREAGNVPTAGRSPFPRWGWGALAWTLVWWLLAWTRWTWFQPLQAYTFFPLWLGFIVTVNAAVQRRTGSCLMRRAPRRWLALFAASAACWWAFEWLNRFVRNWHYLNVDAVGAAEYFLHATVCFSTVLPAVAAVAEGLSSHARWNETLRHGPAWRWLAGRPTALTLALAGCVGLFATGIRPQWFYPALWLSPLALQIGAAANAGGPRWVQELARGDWRRVGTWMVAALVCGFFWEMWNAPSLAKWIYTVPGVERWCLFEMPALGYAGYLPFGVECLLVVEWVIGARWQARGQTNAAP